MPVHPRLTDEEMSFLRDILSENPSRDQQSFIVSTAFEARQSITSHDAMLQRVTDHVQLPDWLEPSHQLGPYERFMLKRFLDLDSNVVIFRSGTGSGKTSLLSYVANY